MKLNKAYLSLLAVPLVPIVGLLVASSNTVEVKEVKNMTVEKKDAPKMIAEEVNTATEIEPEQAKEVANTPLVEEVTAQQLTRDVFVKRAYELTDSEWSKPYGEYILATSVVRVMMRTYDANPSAFTNENKDQKIRQCMNYVGSFKDPHAAYVFINKNDICQV